MSKIIQKQLRRSLPVFLIITVLNITVFGFLFNMDFSFRQSVKQKTEAVIDWLPGAKADTASSSVTVKNAPPVFSVNAAESPTSSSTSPVNIGANMSFVGTADDPENNSYYLVVCDTNAVTPGAGGGTPTCGGVRFCASVLTADTVQATCNYNNVTDPGAETKSWYAFVCDNHATEADCSSANQGSGDPGSPFYVNHPSVFTAISTTVDNRDPGGTFTMQAASTDPDSQGGVDEMILSVCSSNSWSTTTGCAATTLCTATSTGPNISCDYTTTAPVPHGATTYYGFVKDWHNLAATGNSRSSVYNTNDVTPQISNIVLNSGNAFTLNSKGAGTKTIWATSTSVTDNNGCSDIVDATSTLYLSNQNYTCAANDNNCYQVAAAACAISDCSGGSDTQATVVCSANMAFHATPSDNAGDNPYSSYNWRMAISPYDQSNSGIGTSTGIEVLAAAVLEVSELSIPYGILQAGQHSGTSNATTTVLNYGNCPLNNLVEGTWMSNGGNRIGENNQKFEIANFDYPAGVNTLSSTSQQMVDINVQRPTSSVDVSGRIYWGINVPALLPSGDYTGVNTFIAAIKMAGGNWN